MSNDILYQIALTQIPTIGDIHARKLISIFNCAETIFKTPKTKLEKIEGIGSVRANAIKSFTNFSRCEQEIKFIEKHAIQPLFISDSSYPKRLLHCVDAPVLLYTKGSIDLNKGKMLSIVGTRNNSEYGKWICQKIINEIKHLDVIVISGLAYGIDTHAHKYALENNLPTIAVMAHGLDTIYPYNNKLLSEEIINNGCILSEFMSATKPDKQNFPKRNRITAGLCDALLVVESGRKGGSLITADIANSYNKDVFATPGRITDASFAGCHDLITSNKAHLITSAKDIIDIMGWHESKAISSHKQTKLFVELTGDENKIISVFENKSSLHFEQICFSSGFSVSQCSSILLSLEIKEVLSSLPGKMYVLL
jgi:DNA processing protein